MDDDVRAAAEAMLEHCSFMRSLIPVGTPMDPDAERLLRRQETVARHTLAALDREADSTRVLDSLERVTKERDAWRSRTCAAQEQEQRYRTARIQAQREADAICARLRALVEEGRHAQECAWLRPIYSHTIRANVPVYHTNVEPCNSILADLRALLDGDAP